MLRPGALLATLALAGCMSVPVPDLPDRTPSAWTQVPQGQGVAVDARQWWKVLADRRWMAWSIRRSPAISTCSRPPCACRPFGSSLASDSRFLPEISASAKQVQDAAAVDTYFHAGIEAIWDLGVRRRRVRS